ncbi:MFS general substrate transporter [Colletotrichum zoysiae]|uniref:MFS general substrate transporter n=1 Tax=Colletotrichum zoysiae TaxID=1216348 RepID=A0AAD9H4M2_9PEZI|nr:MFS general substrate transporter [Colletotrichum zoysiae]
MSDTATQSEKKTGDLVSGPARRGVDAEAAHCYVIDPAAEARLVRKQDLRVLPMVAGIEADLGLGAYGFNVGACLYYGVHFFADVPASLSVKRFVEEHLLGRRSRIITIGVGIFSLYLFPADPSETRIFDDEERALAMARIFRDQPAIREHKEKITWGLVKRGVVNVNVLVGAWIYTCDQITVQGLSIFTATILRLNYPGRSTVEIQLLSVPPSIFGMVFGLGVAYVTMKTRMHGVAIAACAGLNVVGYSIWLASTNVQARYAAIFLNTAGGYSFGTLILSWTLANAAPDTVRNVANGAVSGLANIGSIAATWSYINTDAKTGYRIGNGLNTATAASVVVASLGLAVYQKLENKKREQGGRDYRLEAPEDGVATLGHLHPDFRYIH